MHRISLWLEQLPLRRRSSHRRTESNKPSKSSKSSISAVRRLTHPEPYINKKREHSCEATISQMVGRQKQQQQKTPVTHSSSWNSQEVTSCLPVLHILPYDSQLSNTHEFNSSRSCERPKIRTNPWISRENHSFRSVERSSRPGAHLIDTYIDNCHPLNVKNLDDSACSSGYGSQDTSPESSVHSPDWQATASNVAQARLVDKSVECHSIDLDETIDVGSDEGDSEISLLCSSIKGENNNDSEDDENEDEHLYYELEAFNRLSMHLGEQECSSDSDFAPYAVGYISEHRRTSPIYASPYISTDDSHDPVTPEMEYPNTRSGFTYISTPHKRPSMWLSFPPPPPNHKYYDEDNDALLAELDAHIAELQLKSAAVHKLVDKAQQRRHELSRDKRLCFVESSDFRNMKLVLQQQFELVL
ncbi:hypothetical protein AB6A40_002880 [Gnathostoma spinigerum]|uniref:Uncharacterized protein n=1 Tax=Gnathostoma spinigerum TaxID=75299 RepID=A0ABD6EAE1_9BILA